MQHLVAADHNLMVRCEATILHLNAVRTNGLHGDAVHAAPRLKRLEAQPLVQVGREAALDDARVRSFSRSRVVIRRPLCSDGSSPHTIHTFTLFYHDESQRMPVELTARDLPRGLHMYQVALLRV